MKIEISGDDVAAVLAFCLDDAKLAGVTFEVVAGDQPLESALAACRNQRGSTRMSSETKITTDPR
jgi:hypothetical protein